MVHLIPPKLTTMNRPPQDKVAREAEVTALRERLAIYQCEQRLVCDEPVLMADCVPDDDSPGQGEEIGFNEEDGKHIAACDVLEEINLGTEDDQRPTFISATMPEADSY
ncbi:hypothetical protein LINPERHAP2_LOCUS29564 [Linum perenne]